ncbi:nuclear transport factor 2-like isoform X1 [Phragmites australis]|uniref:nuclear transport factor 2-like isoform X1 n=1 Tax=Phragmites australis TaxID=29695 RepID=UPI002D79A559|nr:nuclear transport factor 2-like isoform X1 [Phragmites australis]
MASAAATQVGTYFLRNYYNLLQQNPDVVHQFYSDASTMVRVDDLAGTNTTVNNMMDIHSLIMSLNFTQIEIKTANFINSWGDGVLVMVSGLVQTKEYSHQRKFIQMFFLAPQEKGYFVLNDYFHFVDQEQVQPAPVIAQENFESNLASNTVVETVPEYIHEEESQAVQCAVPITSEENDAVDNYTYSEPPQQVVYQPDNWGEEPLPEEPLSSFSNGMATAPEEPVQPPSVPPPYMEEPVGEPVKKTYASILKTAKAPPAFPVAQQAPVSKLSHPTTESNQAQHSASTAAEKPRSDAFGDVAAHDDEESKSVYVGNVPSSVSEADLENEFKKFGRLIPDGVAIRSRKETGGYYAFVEFEELSGVHNALKASPIEINGRQIYVEERKPNSGIRGRGGRGRFSGGGRGNVRGGGDEYNGNRGRSNGYQRAPHQERGILGSHAPRN